MTLSKPSRLGSAYKAIHDLVAGTHPNVNIFHFQWLTKRQIQRDMKLLLPETHGTIMDVGSGKSPYKRLLPHNCNYISSDNHEGSGADLIFDIEDRWPIIDGSLDAIIMTQVIEYSIAYHHVAQQCRRTLKPDGVVIITSPFIYNLHGGNDLGRPSPAALDIVFKDFENVYRRSHGAIFTTLGTLWLNWLDQSLNRYVFSRKLKGVLLPFHFLVCASVNLMCVLMDRLDRTNNYFVNYTVKYRRMGL